MRKFLAPLFAVMALLAVALAGFPGEATAENFNATMDQQDQVTTTAVALEHYDETTALTGTQTLADGTIAADMALEHVPKDAGTNENTPTPLDKTEQPDNGMMKTTGPAPPMTMVAKCGTRSTGLYPESAFDLSAPLITATMRGAHLGSGTARLYSSAATLTTTYNRANGPHTARHLLA